ncbi:MAG: hypothetical protein WC565_04125 [Parcubacteria group bacterium]
MISFANFLTGSWRHRAAAAGLIRRLQTTVEHMRVTNATVTTDMVRGEVVCLTTGVRQALLAQANKLATSEWVGVVCEPIAADETGIVRINGKAWVLFEAALDPAPVAGDPVYLSKATAGRLTNVYPLAPGFGIQVGIIVDASPYATDGACWVQLQRCCAPVPQQ